MHSVHEFLHSLPAGQQPDWNAHVRLPQVREELSSLPPLVRSGETDDLHSLLSEAAAGRVQIIQSGDCAEDWDECTPGTVARKTGLLEVLAGVMKMNSQKPVVCVGRIAGQYAKPRSRTSETVGGVELPVYRGHMVNSPEPDPLLRTPDPDRLLIGYRRAREVIHALGWGSEHPRRRADSPVWTSHEALLLDYELPMIRRRPDGRLALTSTHWPWIGERTRQVNGAHVALLAAVANPVACKIGPDVTADELLALCRKLDPKRLQGRLTLICRMGAHTVRARLPRLVAAVRDAGHPVVWLSDPMHGNTVSGPGGLKTRLVKTVVHEVVEFHHAVNEGRGIAGGLHLETTPDNVTECVRDEGQLARASDKYTSLCDPRLNPRQAISVASAWLG
ncbi:3-deoxy-7-phosphoheptulonate synthase [Streptomyces sp. AM 4-1-1]|uniref:3-deoxy-7-phosphoheptulonate synthase n=1 Tax=Streptomyces sp. AM 4-1-1 TaxID=3028710 RepID=UPI0023B970EA|nr:3-deoxy-7-phosphoheptulonate synthase [Streptomyces sp. AM 4-1-1]WEH36699.1 3-deoxy-7-phosphoheptulonate synthase [Streptomyces sp. AM 4-1-1]